MRTSLNLSLPLFATILSAALSACGGGGGADSRMDATIVSTSAAKTAAALSTDTTASESTTWTTCATEGGNCNVSGTAEVRYGTATQYVTKTVTGPVTCSNDVFGDPAPGYAKTCSIASGTTSGTAGTTSAVTIWTACAVEGGNCNVSGTAGVRYGTATQYVTKTVTGPVSCSNSVFGDPAPGYAKSCSIGTVAISAIPAPTPAPATWAACATEGGTCNVSGTAEVRYGTATQYVTKTVTGPVACSNTVFGDPAPDQAKTCSIGVTSPLTPSPSPSPSPTPTPTPTPTPVPAPYTTIASGGITAVQLVNSVASAQTNANATFGQVFAQGDVPADASLTGKTAGGVAVPLQVDVKARHADGSLRHAVITAQLPSVASGGAETVTLFKAAATAAPAQTAPTSLLNNGFTASFTATIGGVQYTASADALLKAGKYTTWLSGPLVNEWLVSAPLKTASGADHPHLTAQFAIRSYAGSNSARVDVTIENGWAFQASPQNLTYDAQMLVGGQPVYSQAALTHYHHARWRKVFWWGKAQPLNVRHNIKYLLASKALPNYDQSLVIPEATIASWKNNWSAAKTGPMQTGLGVAYMPTTGGRSDLGLLPSWSALYLLSMDQRMKDISLGMSEAAGAWSIHYRDKNSGRPVTLAQYPYMSTIVSGGDTINPATKQSEAFPACPDTVCSTPMTADSAHQPAFAYLPYLVTGDYYHLEELQFWANFSSFNSNPGYRESGKGLVQAGQVRAQAWSLRTIAEAAYITPDNDPQKANLNAIVNYNIDWYNTTYTNNAAANKLGIVVNGYAVEYDSNTGIGPWQDDFFTAAVGRMVELGFTNAQPLLTWKSKFVVDRMVGTGFCWIEGANYNLKVRDSASSPFYTSIAQVYLASNTSVFAQLACGSAEMASSLKLRVGEMTGDLSTSGQQADMQPALAYAVGVNAGGAKAWSIFAGRTYKPDFTAGPQYAVVPR
jgi:hypothetical protein